MAKKKTSPKKTETKKPAAKNPAKSKAKKKAEKKPAKNTEAKKAAPKKKAEPKPAPKKEAKPEPTLKSLQRSLEKLENENQKLRDEIKLLKETGREQKKQISKLEGKLDTRVKREEVIMEAIGIHGRTKKGEKSAVSELNQSLIKTDEHLLKLNKRLENVLNAIKNHREYLIRLNKRVYKEDPVKLIDLELDVMCNTLNVMALSGFSIDKGLFADVKKIRKMMEKQDFELAKVKKRMSTFIRKFDEELERFNFESIYKKAEHIPGYR